ncbi:hypothetical protein GF312_18380 [Candidatus Poribacteria bacterium]|nr:hypothetical protein [Candidatus Poribacteria bacterium]
MNKRNSKFRIIFLCTLTLIISLYTTLSLRAKIVEKIVAIVSDEVITKTELEERMQKEIELRRPFYQDEQKLLKEMEAAKPELLELMVDELLFIQAAIKRGIRVTDAEVQQYVNTLRNQTGSEEAFKEALAAEGYNLDTFKRDIKRRLLSQRLNEEQFGQDIRVTEQEIIDFYEENKDQFPGQSDVLKLRHIFLKFDITEKDKEQALAKVEKIINMAKSGEDFAELARQFSDHEPTRESGGDLGYFIPGMGKYDIRLEEAASELQVGQISFPIETPGGYDILKLVDKKEGSVKVLRIHIAIWPSPDVEKAVKQKANSILKEIETGAKFSVMVSKYSQDPLTREEGGDWKEIPIESMGPELKDAFESFQVGQISKPVKTPLGFHIFKIVDRQELSRDEKEQLRELISHRKLQEKLAEYSKKLREKSYIQVLAED